MLFSYEYNTALSSVYLHLQEQYSLENICTNMLSTDFTRTEKLHVTMVNFVIPLCLAASSTTVTRKAQGSGESSAPLNHLCPHA